MSLAFEAMQFAREVHAGQARKYTGNPYADHLAEVAGIVSTVAGYSEFSQTIIATAWLHDCVDDQDVTPAEVCRRFGPEVQAGVLALSDLEVGNRAERKAASRKRLASAPWWVQNIKVADLTATPAASSSTIRSLLASTWKRSACCWTFSPTLTIGCWPSPVPR